MQQATREVRQASRDEMKAEGWVDVIINGVDCMSLKRNSYELILEWTPDGLWTENSLNKVIAQRGQPYKVHGTPDGLWTIEY